MHKSSPKIAKNNSNARAPRDLGRTRKLILKTAIGEFARAGIEGARVDTIAKKSGVNKGMIYYIFKSKEELYLAALEALFEEKTRGIDPPPKDAKVSELLSNYFDAFASNYDIVRMLLHDVAAGAEALRELKSRRPDLFEPFVMVSDLLASRMKANKLKRIDADKAVALSVLLLVALVAFQPHMDLMRDKVTPAHASLSNLDQWKAFLAELAFKILT